MYAEAIIKMLSSTVEFAALIMLSFSIFRIPVKSNLNKILFSATLLAVISLLQRYVVNEENYAVITSVICFVILAMFIHNLPLFYAIIVCISGYVAFAIIQMILALVVIQLFGFSTLDTLQTSMALSIIMQITTAFIILPLIIWMQYKKLGFMFIIKRFRFRSITKGFNALLSAVIILSIIIVQTGIFAYQEHLSLFYTLSSLTIISAIGLIVTYRKNKNDIKNRYERLSK